MEIGELCLSLSNVAVVYACVTRDVDCSVSLVVQVSESTKQIDWWCCCRTPCERAPCLTGTEPHRHVRLR